MNYVEVTNVSKKYKDKMLVGDVSFEVKKGEILGIVGLNGSGKTVILKCICGLMEYSSGTIKVNDKIIGKECEYPKNMGVIIETPGFLPYYSGIKNLEYLASLKKKIGKQEIKDVLVKVGLGGEEKKLVAKYSLGMKQRLGIAQAIMEDPEFLILDEPMNGLDKEGIAEVRRLLLEMKEAGKTMIITSHNEEDIKVLCDKVIEMDKGKLVAM
jgi:ABC-2 type transport system ATP-binding protein